VTSSWFFLSTLENLVDTCNIALQIVDMATIEVTRWCRPAAY